MYKHILIATDGSDVGQKGVDHGIALARDLRARVTLITVTEPYPVYAGGEFGFVPSDALMGDYMSGQKEAATAMLSAAEKAAASAGLEVSTIHVAEAQPAEAIIEAAQSHGCDLVVMGSHGRRGIGRLALGSKTWEVVAHSHVPVLVVR
ncbi:MAG: universal stress protein [Sphingobium sp.]|uniref:universal stress protein n=1 Tax=Sphingobium sp. TaxID=1912891 RepID=UPI0029A523CE|nr:universal stress protein [Sphingobium sp.]MDX3911156.1 universal stress protein [Sphingobium sp.]